MNRVSFLIVGFNLYHSVKDAQNDMNGATTKWLNIRSLCQSYSHLFGKDANLKDIFYFSALAEHLEASKPEVTTRHRKYIECLRETGIKINLNRFKKKEYRCPYCRKRIIHHEEKETDVTMGAWVVALFMKDECDTVVLVTGDTDLLPAVKIASYLYSEKRIVFAFPYKRKNRELMQQCPGSFTINRNQYVRHQFPNPFNTASGKEIAKPASW